MADDKVVIGSNEGTPVKPGDLTKITSVINDSAEDDSIATATIPRMKIKTADNTDAQETSNINKGKIKAKLEEDKPKKKTTVKLKPVIVGETGEAAAAPTPPPPPAPSALRIASGPAPAPLPAQATAVPKIASEDETVKIQKPRSVLASTAVPGVKQTIKLRPSSTTPAPISEAESKPGLTPPPPQPPPSPVAPPPPAPALAGASEAKRTIRLVPKKSDATSGGEHTATVSKPSAPTIKLDEPPQTPQEPSRSASTIKLPSEAPSPEVASGTTPPQKRTLKLKSTRPPEATTVTPRPVPVAPYPSATPTPSPAAPMPTPAPMPVPPPPPPVAAGATDAEITAGEGESREIPPMPVSEEKVYKEEPTPSVYDIQEPSIIFTIAACIAFFVMAYFTWMLVGQYCNNYMDKNITVPGLSGKVK